MKTRVMTATRKRHPPSHQQHQNPSRAKIPQVPGTDLKRQTDAQRRREARAGRGRPVQLRGGGGVTSLPLTSDPSEQELHRTPQTWVALRLQHWTGGKVPPGPGRDSRPTRCLWREGWLVNPGFRGAS